MPFANVPADKQDVMHRCVVKVKESGKDEDAAVAICYASIVEGQTPPGYEDMMKEFTLDLSMPDMLTDLAAQVAQPGKPFDGMRAGTFIDMRGTPVTFDAAELARYVENTKAAISVTRTEGGEIVGLPIDAQNHDKGDAAGWIIDAELQGDVIRLTPRWTELGIELIGSSRQRFFSPTVDLQNKTIIGGSLTNWPATRRGGKTLLRPIELAEGDKSPMEEALAKILEMLQMLWEKVGGEKAEAPKAAPEPEMAQGKQAAEFAQVLQTALDTQKAQIEHKTAILEFARRVTAGTAENPRGLNIAPDALAEALLSMPQETAANVQKMLEGLTVVNFAEKGHNGSVKRAEPVPANIAPYLRQWVDGGRAAEAFFALNPELGSVADFDLTDYQPKEK